MKYLISWHMLKAPVKFRYIVNIMLSIRNVYMYIHMYVLCVCVPIQPYLSKLFSGIARLELGSDSTVSPPITAMISTEGEKVLLPK